MLAWDTIAITFPSCWKSTLNICSALTESWLRWDWNCRSETYGSSWIILSRVSRIHFLIGILMNFYIYRQILSETPHVMLCFMLCICVLFLSGWKWAPESHHGCHPDHQAAGGDHRRVWEAEDPRHKGSAALSFSTHLKLLISVVGEYTVLCVCWSSGWLWSETRQW